MVEIIWKIRNKKILLSQKNIEYNEKNLRTLISKKTQFQHN